jgi:hypothetical protein
MTAQLYASRLTPLVLPASAQTSEICGDGEGDAVVAENPSDHHRSHITVEVRYVEPVLPVIGNSR